jgi:hypothetical protein
LLETYLLLKFRTAPSKNSSDSEWEYAVMHVLVHDWARETLSQEVRREQCRESRKIILDSIRYPEQPNDIRHCTFVLPHFLACHKHFVELFPEPPGSGLRGPYSVSTRLDTSSKKPVSPTGAP